MSRFKRICVFCASSAGEDPVYSAAAIELGKLLARRGIGVVYGGAKVGLMGTLANAVLVGGGEVIGVIPERLKAHEIAHDGLTELFVVDSMHARKAMMAHLSNAFIAMPGGWGTLEETFEMLTWTQLRYHSKPIGLLNVKGYYDRLLGFLDHAVKEGLLQEENRMLLDAAPEPEVLLDRLETKVIPESARWMSRP